MSNFVPLEKKIIPIPTQEEVEKWLISTVQHVFHVEYFLNQFKLGENDVQRPHDIIGNHNKFDWDVIYGNALQYRYENKSPGFHKYVFPSIELHRNQYHHKMWNKPNQNATEEDLLVGSIDAVCSMMESRSYNKRPKTYEAVLSKGSKYPFQKYYIKFIVSEMRALKQPDIGSIDDLFEIPNIGVPNEVHKKIICRLRETVDYLCAEPYGYNFMNAS